MTTIATQVQIDFAKTATLERLCGASKTQIDAIQGLARSLGRALPKKQQAAINVARLAVHHGCTVVTSLGEIEAATQSGQCALSLNRFHEGVRVQTIQLLGWPEPRVAHADAVARLKLQYDLASNLRFSADVPIPPLPVPPKRPLPQHFNTWECPKCGNDCAGECFATGWAAKHL